LHRTTATLLAALLLLIVVPLAHAEFSKMDPRVRIATAQLRGGESVQSLHDAGAAVSESGELDVFIRGTVSRSELEALGVQVRTELPGLFTAYVPVDAIDQVAALPGVTSVRGAVLCEPNLNVSVPTTGADLLRGAGPTFTGLNGAGVLIGDCDSGLDFDHGDFKDAAGLTRVINIWDQNVSPAVNPPSGYAYGREWTAAEIDGGTCTEVDPASHGGHGTHCMGIAAGDGSQTGNGQPAYAYVGMAPKADIVEIATTYFDSAILDGVAYLFARATARGQNAVCNLSLGSQFGPHDGTSDFEAGLTALSGPGRVVCVSAGNDRGTGASGSPYIHAKLLTPAGGDSARMTVAGAATNPPAGSAATVAIDGYYRAGDNINLTLRSPNNTFIGPITLGTSNGAYPGVTYTGVGRVYVENGIASTATGDREIYIEISRTSSTNTPNGSWAFYFTPVSLGSDGRVDMYRFYTFTATIANGTTFTLKNTNDGTVSEPGNAAGVITCAAWETKNSWTDCGGRGVVYSAPAPIGQFATFSSRGPSRDDRQKPDIAAPGMGIGSARSFDYTISCGSSVSSLLLDLNHIINQGTSMAAPHVAGACALLFEKYGALTPDQLKAYLAANATLDGFTGSVWNADWGNGKLHLGDILDPTVAVVSQNGGETVYIAALDSLKWNAGDNVAVTAVDLELSRSGVGGPWESIATGVPNTGSYEWTVTGPTTTNAILRVTAHDAAGNQAQDVSDAEWTIQDLATPALLQAFTAEPVTDGIELRWQFSEPAACRGAVVQRADASTGPWQTLDAAQRTDGAQVVALDRGAISGSTYWYRIVATWETGEVLTFGPVSGTSGEKIVAFALSRATPNPTTGSATFKYAVPKQSAVRLSVYDLRGREVAVLANGTVPAGRYQASWDGKVHGRVAPAGMYFVSLRSPGTLINQRLVVAR
jgi:subtilisin family serine protease